MYICICTIYAQIADLCAEVRSANVCAQLNVYLSDGSRFARLCALIASYPPVLIVF